jgi:hypothetical protein
MKAADGRLFRSLNSCANIANRSKMTLTDATAGMLR